MSAKSKALKKAKSLYNEITPKLEQLGVPVDEFNNDILQELLGKLSNPVEEMLVTLKDTVKGGKETAKGVSKLSGTLSKSMNEFKSAVPFTKLIKELPAKILELIKMIGAAIANPSLLLPALSCGNSPMPDDMAQSAGGFIGKLLGGNNAQRTLLWKAFGTQFEGICGPLNEALPQLKELPTLFDEMKTSFDGANNAVKSVKDLGETQKKCRSLLDEIIGDFKGLLGGGKQASALSSTNGLMSTFERLSTQTKKVDTYKTKLMDTGSVFKPAVDAILNFFRSIEHLVLKLCGISWNSLFDSMRKLHSHYPNALQDARKILKPKGPLAAMFLKPSPYLQKIEGKVDELRNTVDLEKAASTTKSSVDSLLSTLSLPPSTLSSEGPNLKELSKSLKPVEKVRSSVNNLLSATRVQELIFEKTKGGLKKHAETEIVNSLQHFRDNFATLAKNKMKDKVNEEVEQAQAEAIAKANAAVEKATADAMARAEKMKKDALAKLKVGGVDKASSFLKSFF